MTESLDRSTEIDLHLQAGVELPAERKFYFNGFTVATSATDVVIVLLQNGQPVALLNTPHVTAKTFVVKLGDLLKKFEENSGQRIPTMDEINSAVSGEG